MRCSCWCCGCVRRACWGRTEHDTMAARAGRIRLSSPPGRWLVQDVFLQRIGALVLLAAISASAWNLLGGYAGQVSIGHAVYFGAGAYASLVVYNAAGLAADCRRADGRCGVDGARGAGRHADLPAARALFLHGDDRRGRAGPHPGGQLAAARRGGRADGTAGAAHGLGPVVHQPGAVPLFVPRRAGRCCWA